WGRTPTGLNFSILPGRPGILISHRAPESGTACAVRAHHYRYYHCPGATRGYREAPGVEAIAIQMDRPFQHHPRDSYGVARHQHRPHRPPYDLEGAPRDLLLRPPVGAPGVPARQRLTPRE